VVDSRDSTYLNCEADFENEYVRELQETYPDACKEVDANIPEPLIDKDSDHVRTARSQEDSSLGNDDFCLRDTDIFLQQVTGSCQYLDIRS
jgi:hypothetical protein